MTDRLTLCATSRLAQTLRGEAPDGVEVWQTRRALTIGQWLGSLADEALLGGIADLPTALDPFAERLLWEKIIAASFTEATPLFDLQGMAASAAEAHALSRLWNIRPAGAQLADETRLFAGWQLEFDKRCRAAGWSDTVSLQRQLIGLIAAGHFALPDAVSFAGFDRLTPLEEGLMAALSGRGVSVENQAKNAVNRAPKEVPLGCDSRHQVLPCADVAAECAAIAAWAQAHLAADPACRLGIVAPDLASVRDRLEFMLDDALHPALIRPDAAEQPRCFNFSLGRGLADLPLIRVALDLLALGSGRAKVEQSRLSALLLAGGWSAAAAEADGRARLDAALRRDLPYFTTLPALIRLAGRLAEKEPPLCPQTIAALEAFVAALASAPKTQRPGAMGRHLPPGAESRRLARRPRTLQSRIPGPPRFRRGARRLRPARCAARPAVAQRGGAPLVATLPAAHLPAGNARPARHPGARRARKRRPRLRCAVGDGHERRPLAAAAASQPVAAGRIAARGRRGARQRRGRTRFCAAGACPSGAGRAGGGFFIRAGRRQPPAAAKSADCRHGAGRCGAGRGGDAGPATGR